MPSPKAHENAKTATVPFGNLLDEFLAAKAVCSPRYLRELKHTRERFGSFDKTLAADVQPKALSKILDSDSFAASAQRANWKNSLGRVFTLPASPRWKFRRVCPIRPIPRRTFVAFKHREGMTKFFLDAKSGHIGHVGKMGHFSNAKFGRQAPLAVLRHP